MTTKAVYVTGVVIANGVTDSEGDCLNKKDIKRIFTKYLDRATDVMHTRIKNEGVEVLANWITETDTELNGKTVPSGSWMATFAITNEELLSSIKDGSIGGISLGSVAEEAMTKKYWFINKAINYKDLDDMEEVIPLFISFVDKGANQYGLEIMDYDVYINKNDKTGEKMTKENKSEEPMIPLSAIDKLRDIFTINKRETDEEEKKDESKEDKKETAEQPAPSEDITNKELLEKLPELLAQAVKEAITEAVSETEKDTDSDKAKEDKEKKEDEDINKSKENKDEDSDKDTKSEEDKKDDVDINKRQSHMIENTVNPTSSPDFFKMSGRDHFGRKIRN